MNTAYLLIGGNLQNRFAALQHACDLIQQSCGRIVKQSSIFETAAWGVTDQPSFYNQALELQTPLEPITLMQTLLNIEAQMGRKRLQKMGPRLIDIDILLFNDLVLQTELLTVPHPRLTERRFALTPLAQIAPNLIHPITKTTIQQLLNACADMLDVNKIS